MPAVRNYFTLWLQTLKDFVTTHVLGFTLSAGIATLCLSNFEYWKVMECNKVTNIGVSTFLGGWKMSGWKIYDGYRYK